MNNTTNIPNNHIRTHLDNVESITGLIKPVTSVAKKVFESAEHAARIAVTVLMLSLVVVSATTVFEAHKVTAQYSNAISKIVVP
jgi:hypothetical protein